MSANDLIRNTENRWRNPLRLRLSVGVVTIDTAYGRDLLGNSPDQIDLAARRAVIDVGRAVKSDLVRKITSRIRIPRRDIDGDSIIQRKQGGAGSVSFTGPKRGEHAGKVTATGPRIPLSRFNVRQVWKPIITQRGKRGRLRAGITYQINRDGGRAAFDKGFFVAMRGGEPRAWARTGAERFHVTQLRGPSIVSVLRAAGIEELAMQNQVHRHLQERFEHHVDRILRMRQQADAHE